MKFVNAICVFILTVFSVVGCKGSLSDNNSALDKVPVIKPKINFMYPEYATIDEHDVENDYKQPENFEDNEKIAPNGAIVIMLNKAFDQNTIVNGETFKLTKVRLLEEVEPLKISDESIPGTIDFPTPETLLFTPDHTKTLNDHPDMRMDGDTVYHLTLDGVKDFEGEQVESFNSFCVTQESIDITPPIIKDVVVEKEKVKIYFKEPLNPKCINNSYFSLWIDYGEIDPIQVNDICVIPNMNENNYGVIIKPKNDIIRYATDYTVVIGKFIGNDLIDNIKDLAGNQQPYKYECTVNRGPKIKIVTEKEFFDKEVDGLRATVLENGNFALCYTYNEKIPTGYGGYSLKNYGYISEYNQDGMQVNDTIAIDDTEPGFSGYDDRFDITSINNDILVHYYDIDKQKIALSVFSGNSISTSLLDDNVNDPLALTALQNNSYVLCYHSEEEYWWTELTYTPYNVGKFKLFTGIDSLPVTTKTFYNELNGEFDDDINDVNFNKVDAVTLQNGNFVVCFDSYETNVRSEGGVWYSLTENEKGLFAIYSQNGDLIKAPTVFQRGFTATDTASDEGIQALQVIALHNENFAITYWGWGELDGSSENIGKVVIYSPDGDLVAAPSGLQNMITQRIKSVSLNDNYFVTVYSDLNDKNCKMTVYSNNGTEIIEPIIFQSTYKTIYDVLHIAENRFAVFFRDHIDSENVTGKFIIFTVE